jgi:hypothetical protein
MVKSLQKEAILKIRFFDLKPGADVAGVGRRF